MAKVQDFPVGLEMPTGLPRLFCHIEILGMCLFLGKEGPNHRRLLVAEADAEEFSYAEAGNLCQDSTYEGFKVRLQPCRRTDQL